ncbi:MAG: YqgE/AlgH family protein [Actinomycetota bacterium]
MFGVSTKGRLLVATPPLEDPHFDRTVVYVLEHHDGGALGVVINRPTEDALDAPLDRWIDLQAAPSSVFAGGPVETMAMVALARPSGPVGDDSELFTSIADGVVSIDLTADPAIAAADLTEIRVFRGYAGWGEQQLDAAIDAGAWLVLDGDADDLFSNRPDELWRTVLGRQPGRLAWLASAPDDLSFN